MVWVYNSPFTKSEQKVYDVLKRKLKEQDIAKTTIKIMSLYSFLKSQKFSSPKELRDSAFLDSSKKNPIFTEEQSKSVFKSLKQKGGASEYPFTNHVAYQSIGYIKDILPESVTGTAQSVVDLATSPVRLVKENVPFGDLLIGMAHGATKTGITVASDAAESLGGPVGAAAVAIPAAIAASIASLLALGEQDLGQATVHVVNGIPMFGSAFLAFIESMEKFLKRVKEDPRGKEVAAYVPVVSEYVTGQPRKSLSLENLKDQAKSLGMAELQKRGIPTSTEDLQSKVQARGMAELQKRGIPTSTEQLQDQAKARGMAELQKRGLPTSTEQLQEQAKSRGMAEIQKRLPTVPMTSSTAGGKRFSTQRRKHSKWPKTRRNKSAKV